MYRNQFDEFARELSAYYGIKGLIGDERAGLWFRQAQHINPESLEFIKDRIKADHDTMPRNLPRVMGGLYREWSQGRTSENAERKTEPCNDCHGEGLFYPYLLKEGELRYYKSVVACGSCGNWKRHYDSLEMWVGKGRESRIYISRKTKSEIESMSNFAGFDGNLETARRVRELNARMAGTKTGGAYHGIKK